MKLITDEKEPKKLQSQRDECETIENFLLENYTIKSTKNTNY